METFVNRTSDKTETEDRAGFSAEGTGGACQSAVEVLRAPWFLRALAAVVVIKVVLLALDHRPNFFMGDSMAFSGIDLTKWFPPQRSWTYGYFIRWFCLPFHRLWPLLIAQTAGGTLLRPPWDRISVRATLLITGVRIKCQPPSGLSAKLDRLSSRLLISYASHSMSI